MNIFKWLFKTTKEPTTTKATRSKWTTCHGTGKTMTDMRKAGAQWLGTCKVCKKQNTVATKKGVAYRHKHLDQPVTP